MTAGQPFLVGDPSAFVPGGSYYPYMQAYFESLDRLKQSIEGEGAQMVLIWIPSKERIYVPLLRPDRWSVYVTNATGDIGGVEASARLAFEEAHHVAARSDRHRRAQDHDVAALQHSRHGGHRTPDVGQRRFEI